MSVVVVLIAGASLLSEKPVYALRLALRDAPAALPVPVAGVVTRALRDTWGAARSEGRRHQGIDIFAPRGREVVASIEGLVWRTGENRLGGIVVWVMGPGRQLHYYAHLDRIGPVSPGQRVHAGQVLGYVGTSGNARGTPPHLHYGIYTPMGAINPYPLLSAGPASPEPRPILPEAGDGG
ncbi:MAG: M23 family metallopeptidase [Panacagrimonas sp.]